MQFEVVPMDVIAQSTELYRDVEFLPAIATTNRAMRSNSVHSDLINY